MSATTPMPGPKTNHIGLSVIDYRGGKTTLCAGCGHNAITERIIDALFEMGIEPENLAKLSGIGCSSKSPAYFVNRAHGFNSVHGRMPSVATGVALANRKLLALIAMRPCADPGSSDSPYVLFPSACQPRPGSRGALGGRPAGP